MRSIWLVAAGLNGLAALIMGAAAQHLWSADPHRLALVDTGVRHGLPHAAALLALAAFARPAERAARLLFWTAGTALALGATLFTFSLYALAAGTPGPLRPLTPIGGTLLILGWALLIAYGLAVSRSGSRSDGFRP